MRREKGSKRNWDALGALLIVAMVSLWLGMGTARAQQPPGTTLIYAGYNSFVTDGNLSNANEWYNPVSGNPYNAVPGASDAATVVDGTFGPQFKIPNGTVTGSLNCWGAGFNAREEPLTIDASASTGAGGLAISGDPYGPSAANLQVAASTTGPASTQAAVNINAALTAGAWMYAGGNTQINNTSVSSKGLVVVGTSQLSLNSGATLTTGAVGKIPPASKGADFYS
ncbi:MAG TPA: hypothetical protein VGY55_04335, partial [Pirellulales bacterium]|nr:hypothetical protein [Pirellulales bacterium]